MGQGGFWAPIGLLALFLGGLLLARSRYGRTFVSLGGERIGIRPGRMRSLFSGEPGREVSLGEVERVGALSLREGTSLLLFGPQPTPLRLPLGQESAREVVGALLAHLPAEAWEEEALRLARALGGGVGGADDGGISGSASGGGGSVAGGGGGGVAGVAGVAGGGRSASLGDRTPGLEALAAAGLWHLAAESAWPALLARPRDPEAALAIYRIERHRLPAVPRLRLALGLAALHPGEQRYAFDVARLALYLRLKELAREALDALAARPDPPGPSGQWRLRLREHRALPAPASRATFGLEIGMPDHLLEGDTLVVGGRFRVGLDWFVAYRLVPGFWGPPRGLELVDLWGARHALRGDPVRWAISLQDAAPHLGEVHEEGWLWPPLGSRLRAIERAGQG